MNIGLLPYWVRFPAIVLFLAGIALAVLSGIYSIDLTINTFALWSSFLEEKFFALISNNFADELTLIMIYSGVHLLMFTAERNESEAIARLRLHSFIKALKVNIFLLAFGLLFIYGGGFIYFLAFAAISVQLIYLIVFHWLLYFRKPQ
ncbi:MAG: hypothetical protein IPM52_01925 [Bacteroidetes bacterium]|nr:hypothetical protein [Bacteroidota bacterium]